MQTRSVGKLLLGQASILAEPADPLAEALRCSCESLRLAPMSLSDAMKRIRC